MLNRIILGGQTGADRANCKQTERFLFEVPRRLAEDRPPKGGYTTPALGGCGWGSDGNLAGKNSGRPIEPKAIQCTIPRHGIFPDRWHYPLDQPRLRSLAVDRYARVILGYHGCRPEFAEALVCGGMNIADWEPSTNDWDWLGHGIYFWEYAPERAREWLGKGGVVGAYIQVGNCLDLTDVDATSLLAKQFEAVRTIHQDEGRPMPVNRGLRGDLDCLVINELVATANNSGITFDTVRSPFLEGEPAFEGSRILRETHVQIAVRTKSKILGVFRPNLSPER
jgi:hypothetical protein